MNGWTVVTRVELDRLIGIRVRLRLLSSGAAELDQFISDAEHDLQGEPDDCLGVTINGKPFPISHLFIGREMRCARCGLLKSEYKPA